ncbi:hypothetical protein ACFWF7_12925 [Nocardia sp. NPDC060256]|uniref:hypothetical protein n=1 Tax=unclassified Nocardia TaxID=2637762 RepID=UPI0036610823
MKLTNLGIVAATALAVVAGATGCSKAATEDHTVHAIGTSATTSATAAPIRTTEASKQAPAAVADVDCGPVTDAGGGTRTVIAVGTPAGRVGCTEAINVATTYATTVSNTDTQTIEGWQCSAQPDPATPSSCTKDGLIIGLRAS